MNRALRTQELNYGHETEYRRPEKPWNQVIFIEAVSLWTEGYRNTIAVHYRYTY
jgi:hypothetical protein